MSQKSDGFPLGQELDLIIKYLRVDAFLFGGVDTLNTVVFYLYYPIYVLGERLG